MKLYIIGDIHGCFNELEQLLARTDSMIGPDDKYVFLGDYVDRGPDSFNVVDLLVYRSETHPNTHIFLRGNHEDMMMDNDESWLYNGGRETMISFNMDPTIHPEKQLLKQHKEFFNNLKLYHLDGNILCVHAGIDPSLEIQDQTERTMLWTRQFVKYDGAYKNNMKVIFGHTPTETINYRNNQIGIDTGCVFGGKLTCVVMDTNTGAFDSYYQVDSGFDYLARTSRY